MDKNVADVSVKINGASSINTDSGAALETRGGKGILSVVVDLRLDSPDMFSVEYDMMALEKLNLIDAFKPGDEVEIAIGLDTQSTLCVGEISYIEPTFDVQVGYRTTISGYHKLHRLTRGHRSKTWGDGLEPNQAPTDAASDIINNSKAQKGDTSDGLSASDVGSAAVKHDYIPQLNSSDFEFLRATGSDLEYKADSDKQSDVAFKQPDVGAEPVVTLVRDRNSSDGKGVFILSASFRLSTVSQYAKVEVRSWDFKAKKAIVGTAETSTYSFDGTTGFAATGKALYGSSSSGRTYTVVDQPVNTLEEAKSIAQALFDQFSMDFLSGEATIQGNPDVAPGKVVAFEGFGETYSGKYLITSATHTYRAEEGYRTALAFTRNTHK